MKCIFFFGKNDEVYIADNLRRKVMVAETTQSYACYAGKRCRQSVIYSYIVRWLSRFGIISCSDVIWHGDLYNRLGKRGKIVSSFQKFWKEGKVEILLQSPV